MRLIRIGCLIACGWLGSAAWAQDGGSPAGLLVTRLDAGVTLAHDGRGRELRDVSQDAGASRTSRCFEGSTPLGPPARLVTAWSSPAVWAPRDGGFIAFGPVTRGIDNGTNSIPDRMDVADFDCGAGSVTQRVVNLPDARDRAGRRLPLACPTPDDTAVVTPTHHVFWNSNGAICHFEPVTGAFTRELTSAELTPLLDPLADEALHAAYGDTIPAHDWTAQALAAPDDGSLWTYVLFVHIGAANSSRHDFRFIVRRAPDGTLSTVGGVGEGGLLTQPEASPQLQWDPRSGLVLGWGYRGFVAVWDPLRRRSALFVPARGLDLTRPAGPNRPLGPGPGKWRLEADPAFFDGDADGLVLARERQLGLDDTSADLDGDGTLDGLEVDERRTDAADAGAPSLSAAQRAVTTRGPSLLVDDWDRLYLPDAPFGPERGGASARVSNGTLCGVESGRGLVCRDGAGTAQGVVPMPSSPSEVTLDGACAFFVRDQQVYRRRRGSTAEERVSTAAALDVWPVTCDLFFLRRNTTLELERVVDGQSFLVADAARPCPLAGAASELTGCDDRGLSRPPNFAGVFSVIGVDPDLRALLLTVDTYRDQVLVAIDASHAWVLARARTYDLVRRIEDVAVEPGGRRWVLLGDSLYGARVVPVTPGYAPIAGVEPAMRAWETSPKDRLRPFSGTLVGARSRPTIIVLDPPANDGCPGCCACGPGGTICQVPCNWMQPPTNATWEVAALAAWDDIPPGLEPGETLFAGVELSMGSTAVNSSTGWGLFRSTASGAVVRFLDRQGAARLADPPARAALTAYPLTTVSSLSGTADGRTLCFVDKRAEDDPQDDRVWQVALDAARRPASLTLLESGPVVSCAYADDGSLALLRRDATVKVGARTFGQAASGTPRSLHRLGGRWLVHVDTTVRCHDDTGAETGRARNVTAVGPGPRGLVSLMGNDGDKSWGGAASVEDFCADKGPTDRWFDDAKAAFNVCMTDYVFTRLPVRTDDALLTARPDGLVLAHFSGIRTPLPSWGNVAGGLWRIRPAWVPSDKTGQRRLTQLDDLRRDRPKVGLHTLEATTTALFTLPGGDPAAFAALDWEYRAQAKPAPPGYPRSADGGLDGDGADGGTSPGPGPSKPCGCTSGFAPGLVALAWLLAVRRRR